MKEVEKRNKKKRKCFFLLEFAYICRVGRNADIHWNRADIGSEFRVYFIGEVIIKLKKQRSPLVVFPFELYYIYTRLEKMIFYLYAMNYATE